MKAFKAMFTGSWFAVSGEKPGARSTMFAYKIRRLVLDNHAIDNSIESLDVKLLALGLIFKSITNKSVQKPYWCFGIV